MTKSQLTVIMLKNRKNIIMSKKIIDKNDIERRKSFGLGLKELLKQSNMTQKELAGKIGIHENAVSSWITGKSDITYTSLCKIFELEELNMQKALYLLFQTSIEIEKEQRKNKKRKTE